MESLKLSIREINKQKITKKSKVEDCYLVNDEIEHKMVFCICILLLQYTHTIRSNNNNKELLLS